MTFRDKFSWVVAIITLLLLVSIDFSISQMIRRVGNDQDEAEFVAGLGRTLHELDEEIRAFEVLADVWAAWDESYSFVQGKNDPFVKMSLNRVFLGRAGFEYIIFLNKKGEVVYFKHPESTPQISGALPMIADPLLSLIRQDLKWHIEKGRSGIRILGETPYLLVTRPILPSSMEGTPEGVLVIARALNYALISKISQEADFPFSVEIKKTLSDPSVITLEPADAKSQQLSGGVCLASQADDGQARSLWARSTALRSNHIAGEKRLRVLFIYLAVFAGIFAVLMTALIRYLFISRIIRMRQEIECLKELDSFSGRISVKGADEVEQLAMAINGVMESFAAKELQRDSAPDAAYNRLGKQSLEALDNTIEGICHAVAIHWKENPSTLCGSAAELSVAMGRKLSLSADELLLIRWGAFLHDIGMLWVPDSLYFKEGELTEKEWVRVRKHPLYAVRILERMPVFQHAKDIPHCHHENWDGTGYPRGISGEDIPLGARIYAVVDSWYSMTSARPYRPALERDEALDIIRRGSGSRFDPKIVELFLAVVDE